LRPLLRGNSDAPMDRARSLQIHSWQRRSCRCAAVGGSMGAWGCGRSREQDAVVRRGDRRVRWGGGGDGVRWRDSSSAACSMASSIWESAEPQIERLVAPSSSASGQLLPCPLRFWMASARLGGIERTDPIFGGLQIPCSARRRGVRVRGGEMWGGQRWARGGAPAAS
jgi:hypothetical protein